MTKIKYNPEKDVPDLAGKVIVVTGGTSGVGKETIQYLLPHNPSHILFTGRNQSAASAMTTGFSTSHPAVKVTFISCDFGSLESVKSASASILSQIDRLDLLLCVAGIMCHPPALSADGYELQFATNHLSHALLTSQLLPLLNRTSKQPDADVRIVMTSSAASMPLMQPPGGIQFDKLKTTQDMLFGTWRRYSQSKLANILYARALSRHHPNLFVTSVHPGIAFTGLLRSLSWFDTLFIYATSYFMQQPAQELAWNGLWTATADRGVLENGAYYEFLGDRTDVGGDTRGSEKLEEQLWEWTERELEKWV